MVTVAVAVVAGLGALARYTVDTAVRSRGRPRLPWGIFVVNVSGSFLLGLVTGLATHHGLAATTAVVLSAGFAGGYTTLSTWAYDTAALGRAGHALAAVANVVGSAVAGLLAAGAGLALALL